MNNKIKIMVLSAVFTVFMPMFASATEFNFSVEPVQAETQVDKTKTFFDIAVKPDEKQQLSIHLRNDTKEDVVIEPAISSATTNLNGVVEYSPNKLKADDSLKYDLADLVTTEKSIVIPKNGSYDLKLDVKSPKEAFDGIIAGGITLKEKKDDKDDKANENVKGLAIKNDFSYVVAIILHSKDTKVTPELKLTKSFANQVNARNVISNTLKNDQPTYINQLKVISSVYKEGSEKALYNFEKEGLMQVAPNTNFDFPIPLNGEELKPGKYNVKMTAFAQQSKDGKYESGKDEEGNPVKYDYKWDLTSDFEITAKEAKELNKNDVSIKKDYTLLYVILGFLLIIIALLITMYTMNKKNKQANIKE